MKVIVLLLSVVIAVLSGMLMYTFQSGRVPFSDVPDVEVVGEEPVAAPEDESLMEQSTLPVQMHNGMIDELVTALQQERVAVEETRQELDKRESNLKELHASYLEVRRMVEELQDNLETQLIKVEKSQDENFKTLADVYSKMESVSAARSLQHMDSERAALILSRMDSRSMAAVMDSAVQSSPDGSEAVAEWSDAIRRLSEMTGENGL